jgi:hypothetical protein
MPYSNQKPSLSQQHIREQAIDLLAHWESETPSKFAKDAIDARLQASFDGLYSAFENQAGPEEKKLADLYYSRVRPLLESLGLRVYQEGARTATESKPEVLKKENSSIVWAAQDEVEKAVPDVLARTDPELRRVRALVDGAWPTQAVPNPLEAVTRVVFDVYMAVLKDVTGQDESGRLWDIVWMLRFAFRMG